MSRRHDDPGWALLAGLSLAWLFASVAAASDFSVVVDPRVEAILWVEDVDGVALAVRIPPGVGIVRIADPDGEIQVVRPAPRSIDAGDTPSPQVTTTPSASRSAADWHNAGGNEGRNGQSSEVGPSVADLLWSGAPSSIIAWQPVIEGGRVFMVRQTGFPPAGEPNGSPVVALDLSTGAELWTEHISYNAGDWTTWIAGVKDGLVFASRAGNGASVSARLYALDAASGATVWVSDDDIDAGAYDGVVFAPNGDPIIASFQNIIRISHVDGSTVWNSPRTCSVSGTCGGAIHDDAVYVVDAAPGGHEVIRYDLATGAELYAGPVMPGFTLQNTPMAGPDGTIYISRTQNNPSVDFFYAFDDDGAAITERWHVPAAWSTTSEFCVGPDDSVYMMAPGNEIHHLDPATGTMLDASDPIAADFLSPRMGVDSPGRVFFSNGAFSNGRLFAFTADLALLWDVGVTNVNIGAPAIGQDGILVVCGIGTDVRAYQAAGEIPTVSMWGLASLLVLLGAAAAVVLRRRAGAVPA